MSTSFFDNQHDPKHVAGHVERLIAGSTSESAKAGTYAFKADLCLHEALDQMRKDAIERLNIKLIDFDAPKYSRYRKRAKKALADFDELSAADPKDKHSNAVVLTKDELPYCNDLLPSLPSAVIGGEVDGLNWLKGAIPIVAEQSKPTYFARRLLIEDTLATLAKTGAYQQLALACTDGLPPPKPDMDMEKLRFNKLIDKAYGHYRAERKKYNENERLRQIAKQEGPPLPPPASKSNIDYSVLPSRKIESDFPSPLAKLQDYFPGSQNNPFDALHTLKKSIGASAPMTEAVTAEATSLLEAQYAAIEKILDSKNTSYSAAVVEKLTAAEEAAKMAVKHIKNLSQSRGIGVS